MEQGQIQISVCQGQYDRVNGQIMRTGRQVIIERPGGVKRVYMNPSPDSFLALTSLFLRHGLRVHPWATMVGYTTYWTPGTRATEEVESGDES